MTRLNRTEIPLRLRRSRLLVLGDVMLDQTVFGQVARISPEAPIPVMRQENIRNQCGGAANTAMTLGALRIPTVLVGVVGTDTAAETLRQELRNNPAAANITANLVSETNRPTTIKQRFRSQGQQIFRLDHETIDSIAETTANTILDTVRRALPDCEAMIISDYAKGVLTPTMLETVIALAHAQQVLVVIDPAPQSLPYYRGADYLTPNRAELRAMIGEFPSSDPGLSTALSTTCQQYDLGGIVLTRSEEGMSLFCHKDNHSSDRGKHHYLSATVREVYDVTGAGDSLCAVFSAGLAAGYAPTEALELAAAAAAAAIGKVGPATFTMHELLQQIAPSVTQSAEVHTLPALQMQTQLWRETGEKIGFINGCFDLLHPGHVALLQFCTQHCDRLIVAVNSDASVRRLKGCSRPINDAETRCAMLQALPQVATVTVFEDDTPLALLEALRPDCLIKGGDYQPDQVVGAELLASYGGRVFIAPFKHGYATTRTINRINGTG